jgi:8-oxo-dGTP pyrophosphatase MutT (NUDIX family)
MEPRDNMAFRFPISIKGVLLRGQEVLLLKNERDEWELPGGKLELRETPQACLKREIEEETGLVVEIGALVDAWVYTIAPGVHVFIVVYGCTSIRPDAAVHISGEHREHLWTRVNDVSKMRIPAGYLQSVNAWIDAVRHGPAPLWRAPNA